MSETNLGDTEEGRAWAAFCDTLKENGAFILAQGAADNGLDRAEGLRYVTRVTRLALEQFVENYDPITPFLWRGCRENIKLGTDNPDTCAFLAALDGKYEYRIRGRRNTVKYLSMGTYYGKDYGRTGRSGCGGNLEGSQLQINEDGTFEIAISVEPRPGNWLAMDPDTYQLIVRQTYLDRSTEKLADLELVRISAMEDNEILSLPTLNANLADAAKYLTGCMKVYARWTEHFMQHPNLLAELPDHMRAAAHTDPNLAYYNGYWTLEPGEALAVEVMPPNCEYWSFQLNNIWLESLEFRKYRVQLNKHSAAYGPDGSIKIVVSERDPGMPNWIQTAGHRQGTMTFRWIKADSYPVPSVRVFRLADG